MTDLSEREKLLAEAAAFRELSQEAWAIARETEDESVRNILTKKAKELETDAEALETRAQLH